MGIELARLPHRSFNLSPQPSCMRRMHHAADVSSGEGRFEDRERETERPAALVTHRNFKHSARPMVIDHACKCALSCTDGQLSSKCLYHSQHSAACFWRNTNSMQKSLTALYSLPSHATPASLAHSRQFTHVSFNPRRTPAGKLPLPEASLRAPL